MPLDESVLRESNRTHSKETEALHGELSQPRKRKGWEETFI